MKSRSLATPPIDHRCSLRIISFGTYLPISNFPIAARCTSSGPSAQLGDQLPSDVVFKVASQLEPEINTTATVRELEPQAESTTRTRRARLTLADTPAAFRLGTAISVTLSSAIKPRIELPATAVQEVDGKTQIWIIDMQNQTVSPRAVNIVSRSNGSVVLDGGVNNGDRVVTAGVNSLKPGQKIKVDKESPR